MLLETSFCGTKSPAPDAQIVGDEDDEGTKRDMESVLLKRVHDPTKALLAEGITVDDIQAKQKSRPVCIL